MGRKAQLDYKDLYKLYEEFKEANPNKGNLKAFCKKTKLKYDAIQKAFRRLGSKKPEETDKKTTAKSSTDNEKVTKRTKIIDDEPQELDDRDINPNGENIYERRIKPNLIRVEMMYFDGARDIDVFTYYGMSKRTFYTYLLEYPEFKEAVERGKMYSDFEVEKTLYKSITGQVQIEETRSTITNKGEPQVTKIVKDVPPDTGTARWWLVRRKGKKWVDKVDPNNASNENIMADLSDEELENEIAKLQKGEA